MPERSSRFVLASQQAFAFAVVAAVGLSAVGVVELEIIGPDDEFRAGTAVSDSAAVVSSAPVEATVRTVPLAGGTTSGRSRVPSNSRTPGAEPQAIRVVSGAEPVTGFATVGVTWSNKEALSEDDVSLELRTREDGEWSPWQPMSYDPDHQPDPGTEGPDADSVRAGTDAVVVGDVDQVQVRATSHTGTAPEALALAIVDPGEDVAPTEQEPAISGSATNGSVQGTGGDSAVLAARRQGVAPRPQIFSRAQWGADERLRDPGSLRYGSIHAAFVHHTVNANDYSRDDVPSILRGIYAYHTKSRGWSDIGYNFLVDRFGRIWEGRAGGVDRPVVGAHTLGYNEESFAMSAVGNFETAQPSKEMLDAYAALFAWKLSLHGIAADDTKQFVDDRYFQAINGHRDAGSTACPGRNLYAKLPEIRKAAAAIQRGSDAPAPGPGKALETNLSGAAWPDLVVRDKATRRMLIVRTQGQVGFAPGVPAGVRWGRADLIAAAGDVTGDGQADLIARSSASGTTRLYQGQADGPLRRTTRTYARFAGLDLLTGVGDFDGDGAADLVGRRASTQALVLFRGDGQGGFRKARGLADDGSEYDLVEGVGDLDGDDHADLVARSGATLYLVPGTGSGLRARVALPGSWSGFDLVAGRGDATGDGRPDLVARSASTGKTYVYPGDGTGGFTTRIGGWDRFRGVRWLAIAGQLAGSRRPDLAGVSRSTGKLLFFAHNGRKNLGAVIDTRTVVDDADLLLSVGDWNGDGRGDVMTRSAGTGALFLRTQLRRHRFAAPVQVDTGWDAIRLISAVGDVTGDGKPDLVGRGADGNDRVYPGDGMAGFKPSYVARKLVGGSAQVNLGMWDGDQTPDTALRKRDGSLWLWSSATGAAQKLADGLKRYDWVRGLGDLDGDRRADLVLRSRNGGTLFLLPGRRDGFGERRVIGGGFDRYDLVG